MMLDSDSDSDPHLGDFSLVRRRLKQQSSFNGLKDGFILAYDNPLIAAQALGDFQNLIDYLRGRGAFPDSAPISDRPIGDIRQKRSDGHAPSLRYAGSSSATSDSTAASAVVNADITTPASSADEYDAIIRGYKKRCKPKEVRWSGSVAGGHDSEADHKRSEPTPRHNFRASTLDRRLHGYSDLIPSSIALPAPVEDSPSDPSSVPAAIDDAQVRRTIIKAKYMLSLDEIQSKLITKLSRDFPDEPAINGNIRTIADPEPNRSHNGIHVFVDLSNIIIGFYDQIKFERGLKRNVQIKAPPLAFTSLAIVLERGRQVARRVLAGSTVTREGSFSTIPVHIQEAELCGYELNILERVRKPKENKTHTYKHKRATVGGGGYSSASDSAGTMAHANTEQAVDEILHLKMMESVIDSKTPSTMVVASGDAAQAEYSGGFLKMIVRALQHGWKVEVVSWRSNISHEYKSHSFLKKWSGRFKIIYLDEYCEEMLAIYTEKLNLST